VNAQVHRAVTSISALTQIRLVKDTRYARRAVREVAVCSDKGEDEYEREREREKEKSSIVSRA
jgi:hypothetical protein